MCLHGFLRGTTSIIIIVFADDAVAFMFVLVSKSVSVTFGSFVQGKQGSGLHTFLVEFACTEFVHLSLAPGLTTLGGSEKGFRPRLFEGIYPATTGVVSHAFANLLPIRILAREWYTVLVPTFSGRMFAIVFQYALCSVAFGVMEFVLVFNALLYEDIRPGDLQRTAWVTHLSEATC